MKGCILIVQAHIPRPQSTTDTSHRQFATICYQYGLLQIEPVLRADVHDLPDDAESAYHFAEDDVGAVEPRRRPESYKELGAIRIRPTIGHRNQVRLAVRQLEVLVLEQARLEDGLTAEAIVLR